MGHVDDAHQAERDGEPERGDQQHRGGAKAAEGGAKKVSPAYVILNVENRFAQRGGGFVTVLPRGCLHVIAQLFQQGKTRERAEFAEFLDRGDSRRFVLGSELGCADRFVERFDDFLLTFVFQACFKERQIVRVLLLAELGHGVAPHFGIWTAQGKEIERRFDRLAKLRVDVCGREFRRVGEQRLTAGVLQYFAIADPEAFLFSFAIDLRIEQERDFSPVRLEDVNRAAAPGRQRLRDDGIIRIDELLDEFHLLRCVVGQNRLDEQRPA